MNVELLEDILHLFASLSYKDAYELEKKVVYKYFNQFLDDTTARRFLSRFEILCEHPNQRAQYPDFVQKIASHLTPKQKVLLYTQIFELLFCDKILTSEQKQALDFIAQSFKILENDLEDIFEFITNVNLRECPLTNLLYIRSTGSKFGKNIKVEHLEGYFGILYLPSVDTYLLRYIGKADYNLNGANIEPYVVYPLAHGSIIRGEKILPIYYSTIVAKFHDEEYQERIIFSAIDVQYRFPGGENGLHNINLLETGGKLVALMGASGAGKSTLLNVLNGTLRPTEGKVLLNGYDIHQDQQILKGTIGYVAQEDLLIEELTVYENLYYAAKLSLSGLNPEQLQESVKNQLLELGLWEIRDLQVGNVLNKKISGGQRKRLNIALELIREPSVLFVDEPTSGLSSADSEHVMELLKNLSQKGKLVFVVIHQPSSDIFKLFDSLLLLDQGGYPVYYGNPLQAITYFKESVNYVNPQFVECQECGHVNPDILLNIIEQKAIDENGELTFERKYSPEYWHGLYLKKIPKPAFQKVLDYPVQKFRLPPRLLQIGIYFKRDLIAKTRNIPYLLINLLEAPILAFLLAYLLRYKPYNQPDYIFKLNTNLPIYLFIIVLVALFFGLTGSAEEIIKDRKLLKRETFLHLSRSSYLIAKIAILAIISLIQSFTFLIVGNSILEVEAKMFGDYFLLMFVICMYANLLGLNLSATFDTSITVYILIPLVLVPQIVLSGIVVNFDKLNPNWATPGRVPLAAELMVSKWGFEAIMVNQYKNNSYKSLFYEYDRQISNAKFMLNDWIEHVEIKTNRIFDELRTHPQSTTYKEKLKDIAKLLKPEIEPFRDRYQELYTSLSEGKFDAQNKDDLYDLFNAIRSKYAKIMTNVNRTRDEFVRKIKNPQVLLELSNRCENDGVSELVLMKSADPRLVEKNNKVIQLVEPIYLLPPATFAPLDWSTHFYTPYKVFLGYYWETYRYNICVILFFTAMLGIALYYEIFRRALYIFEHIKFLQLFKKHHLFKRINKI